MDGQRAAGDKENLRKTLTCDQMGARENGERSDGGGGGGGGCASSPS